MFRCGKTLLALALLMTIPVAVSAQTPDNPPAPSSPAQPASQPPPTVEQPTFGIDENGPPLAGLRSHLTRGPWKRLSP